MTDQAPMGPEKRLRWIGTIQATGPGALHARSHRVKIQHMTIPSGCRPISPDCDSIESDT
jgi:hypothetical protein